MKIPTPLDITRMSQNTRIPIFDGGLGIQSSNWFSISANHFDQRVHVQNNEDCSIPFDISIFEFSGQRLEDHFVLCRGVPVISPTEVPYHLDDSTFDKLFQRVKGLPNDWFEIWPSDHNVDHGFHFADPWGEATQVLEDLSSGLDITPPKVNHNKISSRQKDKYDCNELHLDSFEGMRRNENGGRMPIFRHFLNLDSKPRTTLVAMHDTSLVDQFVGPDYRPDYLDPIISASRSNMPMLKLTLPPRDPVTKKVYGYKLLTTHLIHGEYGPKDDLLAIINSTT